jgi:hypothetical protein
MVRYHLRKCDPSGGRPSGIKTAPDAPDRETGSGIEKLIFKKGSVRKMPFPKGSKTQRISLSFRASEVILRSAFRPVTWILQ